MYTLQEVAEFFAVVTTFGMLMLFTPLWAPKLTYAGIESPASPHESYNLHRFSTADFACVFVYAGTANALYNMIHGEYRLLQFWGIVMPVLCNAFAVLIWYLAVQFANKKGVGTVGARVLVILFFFPFSAISTAHAIASILGLLSGLELLANGISSFIFDPMIIALFLLLVFSVAASTGLRVGFRQLVS